MGYRVKDRRKELGMSQDELSQKSGISRQTISSIENDEEWNGSVKTLSRLASALDTTVNALFFENTV